MYLLFKCFLEDICNPTISQRLPGLAFLPPTSGGERMLGYERSLRVFSASSVRLGSGALAHIRTPVLELIFLHVRPPVRGFAWEIRNTGPNTEEE